MPTSSRVLKHRYGRKSDILSERLPSDERFRRDGTDGKDGGDFDREGIGRERRGIWPGWDARYAELVSYAREHGNANVPRGHEQNRALGTWVMYQRRMFKQDKLSQDRISSLLKIDFVFPSPQYSSMGESPSGVEQLRDILQPHAHDVLSGRGNFVNLHFGNTKFRELVKKHKKLCLACPKALKANFSTLIFNEIRALKPPGRFLKQNSTTKFWHAIDEKKALDKTRQALREGAPELLKELGTGGSDNGDHNGRRPDRVGSLEGSRRMHGFGASERSFSVNSSDLRNTTESFTSAAGGDGSFPATATTVAAEQTTRGSGDLEQLLSSGNVNTNALLAAAVQLHAAHQQIGLNVNTKI